MGNAVSAMRADVVIGSDIALAGAIAWHVVDSIENPMIPAIAGIWNGIVRFGTLVLTSSLVSRLHSAVLREYFLANAQYVIDVDVASAGKQAGGGEKRLR